MNNDRWYGLKLDGEIVAVISWKDRVGEPTVFDFEYALSSRYQYEVVPVVVAEIPL
jgi:hypothetical protein